MSKWTRKESHREGGNERNCQEICASKARNKWNMRSSNEPLSKKGAKGQKPKWKGKCHKHFFGIVPRQLYSTHEVIVRIIS